MFHRLRPGLKRFTAEFEHTRRQGNPVDSYVVDIGRDMDNYWDQVVSSLFELMNPFAYYEDIVGSLSSIAGLDIVPLYELMQRSAEGTRLVALRHDVDADPLTALRAARYLARYGICGGFYLLHTSPYYANIHHGVVIRNPELPRWVREFIVSGCELGLHNDAFGVVNLWMKDGAAAVTEEIRFLRSLGAMIRGTVAHNSGPVYGAENYEVFAGRKLWQRRVTTARGHTLPLECLSERELALTYEGTFAIPKRGGPSISEAAAFFGDLSSANIRSEEWMRRYLLNNPCCDWTIDCQFWLIGKDSWVGAGKFSENLLFEWNVGLDQILHIVRNLPPGTRSLFVIHPEYVRA